MAFKEAGSIRDFENMVDRQIVDLRLLEGMMPEGDGLATLQVICDDQNHQAASIVILGAANRRVAVMTRGCREFSVKDDMLPEVLCRAVLKALNAPCQFAGHLDRARPLVDLGNLVPLAVDGAILRETPRVPMAAGLAAEAGIA